MSQEKSNIKVPVLVYVVDPSGFYFGFNVEYATISQAAKYVDYIMITDDLPLPDFFIYCERRSEAELKEIIERLKSERKIVQRIPPTEKIYTYYLFICPEKGLICAGVQI